LAIGVPQTTQTSSAPTQQQLMTQVYPFHGQGDFQLFIIASNNNNLI
jgi:hypothetical protein